MQDNTTTISEPSVAALGGQSPGQIARRLWLATRPKFFPASVLPVVLGSAWGFAVAGSLDIMAALLALLATTAVHAGSNVINDVGDELNGTDRQNESRIHPYTGGSRFIQNEIMTVEQMRRWGMGLFVIALVPGFALFLMKGAGVFVFGLIGVALGTLYSLPGVQLSGRGIGEIAIAIAFGVLPVTGAAWLQTGMVDTGTLLVSVPISCWVAAILLINEVPDREADGNAGKYTWPVRFGLAGTRWIYLSLHIGAAAAAGAAVWLHGLPLWGLSVPILLVGAAIKAAGLIITAADDADGFTAGIKMTLGIHTVGALWLTGLVLLAH